MASMLLYCSMTLIQVKYSIIVKHLLYAALKPIRNSRTDSLGDIYAGISQFDFRCLQNSRNLFVSPMTKRRKWSKHYLRVREFPDYSRLGYNIVIPIAINNTIRILTHIINRL